MRQGLDQDVIDDVTISTVPVVIGTGRRLFGGRPQAKTWTLAFRLNGLSITKRRLLALLRPKQPEYVARRSTRAPRVRWWPPPSPTPRGHRPPRGGHERRTEGDGEAGVGPLLEPRRHRRKHQH